MIISLIKCDNKAMSSLISMGPDSVRADFIRIVKSLSKYLSCRKQSQITFPKISKESETILRGWGKDFSVQASFFFQGPENATIFIIDSRASFFKGETGQLLSRIMGAMGLSADTVFICNSDVPKAVKEKIRKILPKVIITLGAEASRILLDPDFPLEELRGKFHEFEGIRVMPTFHPSLLLEQPQYKRQVWEDMKLVMEYAGLKNGS